MEASKSAGKSHHDIVIIGGGIIGSSIACFLAGNNDFRGSVLVIEKAPDYFKSSTALSVGGIRQQFSVPENIEMSKFGIHFIRNLDKYLSVNVEYPDISFIENGYLFLASKDGYAVLKENHLLQKKHDVNVEIMPPDDLKKKFPWLTVDDLSGGSLGLSGEGWLDPHSLLRGFINKAKSLGVEYVRDEVTGMTISAGEIASLSTISNQIFECGMVVNAAGPQASKVAKMAAIDDFPVRPRKRMVYLFRCKGSIPDCPLVIDPTGVYFKSEGKNFLCGMSPPPDRDPDCEDLDVDNTWFEDVIWPVLAQRVRIFDAIRREHSWAGHYAYNIIDQNAILGPHPEIANLICANGFSGHGLQQAPAVGRGISELITYGKYTSLDLRRFRYERFAKNELVWERNIV